jgi:hypothetical protein
MIFSKNGISITILGSSPSLGHRMGQYF